MTEAAYGIVNTLPSDAKQATQVLMIASQPHRGGWVSAGAVRNLIAVTDLLPISVILGSKLPRDAASAASQVFPLSKEDRLSKIVPSDGRI
jgi:hypothetical protein